jgi:hypothetical protein
LHGASIGVPAAKSDGFYGGLEAHEFAEEGAG